MKKQLRKLAVISVAMVAALAASGEAQTERTVTFVTNSYDLRVQQFSAGSLSAGSCYVSFGGEAKAINNKLAADLKTFAFTVFYTADASGAVVVTDGTFLVQTTNKDRSPVSIGGDILPGAELSLRANGTFAPGQRLSLPLVGSEGTELTGLINASIDKSAPPKLEGTLTLTYPVVR